MPRYTDLDVYTPFTAFTDNYAVCGSVHLVTGKDTYRGERVSVRLFIPHGQRQRLVDLGYFSCPDEAENTLSRQYDARPVTREERGPSYARRTIAWSTTVDGIYFEEKTAKGLAESLRAFWSARLANRVRRAYVAGPKYARHAQAEKYSEALRGGNAIRRALLAAQS